MLLVGDSISMGYTLPLRGLLRDACVVHVPENAATSRHGMERIAAWLGDRHWDVIHVNFGLHDIKRDRGVDEVPIDEYRRNVRSIVQQLLRDSSHVVWATITPVPDGPVRHGRRNGDVIAYNAAAVEIMHDLNVPVDDLYSFAVAKLRGDQEADDVHFDTAGCRLLAEQVARAVNGELHASR